MDFSIQIFQLVALRCTSNRQHAILNLTSSPLYSGGSKYRIHTVVIFQEGQYNLRTQGWQMALYLHFVCSMLSRGIMQQTWHGAMLLSNDQENIVGTLHCCNTHQQSSTTWQNVSDRTWPVWPNHCEITTTHLQLSANTVHTSAEIAVQCHRQQQLHSVWFVVFLLIY